MPDLQDELRKAREEEAQRTKRKITKGVRPDRILRGEIQFGDNGQIITHPEASFLENAPKSEQTQNKVRTNPHHNPEQTQNKQRTKSEQEETRKNTTQNKPPSQPRTQPRTKSEQTQNKVRTEDGFLSLSGLQRRIVLFIYEICRVRGDRSSGSVALAQLATACETSPAAAQVTARRLMQKKMLHRVSYKNGRGGWTIYELPEEVYSQVFQLETQNKVRTNTEQSQNKPPSQPRTQPRTNASSSSSKDLDLKTTTTDGVYSALDAEWEQIDCLPLSDLRFGRSQVAQIARSGQLTPKELQDSIHAFAFDLAENQKAKTITGSPLNYFMGILRRGPYAPPANYEAPLQRQLREYRERKEESVRKQKAELQKIKELEFETWAFDLPDPEIQRLAPIGTTELSKRTQLREHFEKHIWETLLQRLCEEGKLPKITLTLGKELFQEGNNAI